MVTFIAAPCPGGNYPALLQTKAPKGIQIIQKKEICIAPLRKSNSSRQQSTGGGSLSPGSKAAQLYANVCTCWEGEGRCLRKPRENVVLDPSLSEPRILQPQNNSCLPSQSPRRVAEREGRTGEPCSHGASAHFVRRGARLQGMNASRRVPPPPRPALRPAARAR